VPDGDRSAFVLGGRKGGRLLVLRAQNTRGMAYTIGTLVEVRGAIVVPPASKHVERRPASRTAIARRMRASALVKAARVSLARES
jgi:hypothetical protein